MLITQDFSSANVPISRETWAPRDAEAAPDRAPPPAGSEPYRPPQSYSSRSPPGGPAYEDRARAPPSDGGRRDEAPRDYGGGGGYQRSSRWVIISRSKEDITCTDRLKPLDPSVYWCLKVGWRRSPLFILPFLPPLSINQPT